MNKTTDELVMDFLQLTIIPRLMDLTPPQRWKACDLLIKHLADFSQQYGKEGYSDRDRRNN